MNGGQCSKAGEFVLQADWEGSIPSVSILNGGTPNWSGTRLLIWQRKLLWVRVPLRQYLRPDFIRPFFILLIIINYLATVRHFTLTGEIVWSVIRVMTMS